MKTSFGSLQKILEVDQKVKAEYLVFEKAGRSHKHREYESFTVLSGRGDVECGEKTYQVQAGDSVTIPPETIHRMIPAADTIMTGLLWYHDQSGRWHLHK